MKIKVKCFNCKDTGAYLTTNEAGLVESMPCFECEAYKERGRDEGKS